MNTRSCLILDILGNFRGWCGARRRGLFTMLVLLCLVSTGRGADSQLVHSGVPPFIGHPAFDEAPTRASLDKSILRMGNGYIELEIRLSGHAPANATLKDRVAGRQYALHLLDPLLITPEHSTVGSEFAIEQVRVRNEADQCFAYVDLRSAIWAVEVSWELGKGDHFIRETITSKNSQAAPVVLNEIWPERLGFDPRDLPNVQIKSTSLTDVVVYLSRPTGDGLFMTLDFPFCLLKRVQPNRLDVGYPPYQSVASGESVGAHAVVLGIFSAPSPDNPDSGPGYAFLRWVTRAYPPRIREPQIHMYHIDNSMYDPRGNLYYSYEGPDMGSYLRNLKGTLTMLQLARELGFNSYQTMEEPFAFLEGLNPDPEAWNRIRKFAEESGIRLGEGPISNQGILTPMNNPYLKPFSYGSGGSDPGSEFYEWDFRDEAGKIPQNRIGFCLGIDRFERYFEDELVRLALKYGFNLYNYDELPIRECFNTAHDHPVGGPASIYRQVLNLTRVLDNVRRRVPGLLWDTNLGFIPLQPKIVRYVDGIYPTDPVGASGLITLNRNLNFDEARRQAYTTAFTEMGLPPVYFRQCQYFLAPNSVVDNSKTFEYEILVNFAMGPNLAVGQLWTELQSLPYGESLQAQDFLKHWIEWAKKNYALLASTRYLGEGNNGGYAYSHIDRDHGYLFLVNPNYWSTKFTLQLDQHIGLWNGEQFALRELHPAPRYILADRLPWPNWGDTVPINVGPLTVQVIEIDPANEVSTPILEGVEGKVEVGTGGVVRVKMQGPQGHQERFALILPPRERAVSLSYQAPAEVVVNTERQLKQPSGALLGQELHDSLVWGTVRFPRKPAEPELRTWAVRPASLEEGLRSTLNDGFQGEETTFSGVAMGSNVGGFAGAYLENVFAEQREVDLELRVGEPVKEAGVPATLMLPSSSQPGSEANVPRGTTGVWYSAQISLPFVPSPVTSPSPSRHLYLLLLLGRDQEIDPPKVWINSKEAPVRYFHYARVDAGCYYVDGTDAELHNDTNTVVIFLKRKD
jgi:hypothetical protein